MLTEMVRNTEARACLTTTSTKKEGIIRKALAGDGLTKFDGWLPLSVRFPMAGYTSRPMLARVRATA
jgi:hypothetical protein